MTQIPILFVGDTPSLNSGLARIARDLAMLTSRMPEFRVGFFGRGGLASRQFPFPQYIFQPTLEKGQWGEAFFEGAWTDFAGLATGVVFSIWDPSRVTWIGRPYDLLESPEYKDLGNLLVNGDRIRTWGYFPIDGYGPNKEGALTGYLSSVVAGYDRQLAYSKFGQEVLRSSLRLVEAMNASVEDVDWLPHGLNLSTFEPRGKEGRKQFGWDDSHFVVGCVMANQPRKDFGTFFRTADAVHKALPHARFYLKVDDMTRHWDVRALVSDYGLADVIKVDDTARSDHEMSWLYSMCDLTVLPTLGEGFGYPIVESLACGVPCLTTDYAAGPELLPTEIGAVPIEGLRIDTRWNMMRPTLDPRWWINGVIGMAEMLTVADRGKTVEECRAAVAHLDWSKLWPSWKRWLLEGLPL